MKSSTISGLIFLSYISLFGCQKDDSVAKEIRIGGQAIELRKVAVANDSIQIWVPSSWVKMEVLPLFGPCYKCGPETEINTRVSDGKAEKLTLSVVSYCREASVIQADNYKQTFLKTLVEQYLDSERGNAVLLDSVIQGPITAIGVRTIRNQKVSYVKRITARGRRRSVSLILEGPTDKHTIEAFQGIQQEIIINPAYLN
ncbi:hypothetical protein [Hymenobacter canadensis]|uniref:Uncharacterized protein n=1 Tax=Hymenobacter canadensis TaxID=2999067 RepID=A0ABY7LI59_9BACT|nr:hypothetical protein [Hymenobacter canadensis]WBA40142.1 hypothetical protein O3303_09870 [Hymenobacter canadensis]